MNTLRHVKISFIPNGITTVLLNLAMRMRVRRIKLRNAVNRLSVNFHRAGLLQDHVHLLDVFLLQLERDLLLQDLLLQVVVQPSHLKSFREARTLNINRKILFVCENGLAFECSQLKKREIYLVPLIELKEASL